ncbi:MAG: sigma-70 family RNA polymerase sigma factor [Lachnospiraceae bacterium]|nr:sigma-70 family RNA polymerase sigma factor [Lachnospiraceae bacterium]
MGIGKGHFEERLQIEFDAFVKKSIKYIIDHVLEKYVNSLKSHKPTIYVGDPGDKLIDRYVPGIQGEIWDIDEDDTFTDERILEGLSRLGKKQRLIIELDFIKGLTIGEIAEMMRLSEKSVRNRKSEALSILRRYLEE